MEQGCLGGRTQALEREGVHALGGLLQGRGYFTSFPLSTFTLTLAGDVTTHLSMQDIQGVTETVIKVGRRIQILGRDRRESRLEGEGPSGSNPKDLFSFWPQLSPAHHIRI